MNARKTIKRFPPDYDDLEPRPAKQASGYGKTLFELIRIQLDPAEGGPVYIPPDQLARAVRLNPGVPLPADIHDYLCDFLEGKIEKPKGRRPNAGSAVKALKYGPIPLVYERILAGLQRRKRSVGLEGWAQIRDADWWQGPPSQRAARMTCRSLRLPIGWQRVLNIVSEANK